MRGGGRSRTLPMWSRQRLRHRPDAARQRRGLSGLKTTLYAPPSPTLAFCTMTRTISGVRIRSVLGLYRPKALIFLGIAWCRRRDLNPDPRITKTILGVLLAPAITGV